MCGSYPSTNSVSPLDQMEFVIKQQSEQGARSDGRPSQNLGNPQVQGAIDAAREVEKKREEEASAPVTMSLSLPPIVAQSIPTFTATPAAAPVVVPTSPYSTTVTTAPMPAATAAPAKKKATSSLKIAAAAPSVGAGTGLNIGI